jgi:hypothetical protein
MRKDYSGIGAFIGSVIVLVTGYFVVQMAYIMLFEGAVPYGEYLPIVVIIFIIFFCGVVLLSRSIYHLITRKVEYLDGVDLYRDINEEVLERKLFEIEELHKERMLTDEEYQQKKIELYDFFS